MLDWTFNQLTTQPGWPATSETPGHTTNLYFLLTGLVHRLLKAVLLWLNHFLFFILMMQGATSVCTLELAKLQNLISPAFHWNVKPLIVSVRTLSFQVCYHRLWAKSRVYPRWHRTRTRTHLELLIHPNANLLSFIESIPGSMSLCFSVHFSWKTSQMDV